MKPLVCLTGGGTAGHVTPHFAIKPLLAARGFDLMYVGGNGIERSLVTAAGIEYHTIATGKLRRYLSMSNFADVLRVLMGVLQATVIMVRRRPQVVFSKGGFVAVPVCVAARLAGVPVVSHESDLTPGLATRLIKRVAAKILYTFPESKGLLPPSAEYVGSPVRGELFAGERVRGLALCQFPDDGVRTVLVMGGSQGAQRINDALLGALPGLVQSWRVIHLSGQGKAIPFANARYRSFEYVRDELPDLYAAADIVVSRAGANSLFELLALRKPMLLIPLVVGSRGDQVVNAEAFQRQGWAQILPETNLTPATLSAQLQEVWNHRETVRAAQATFDGKRAAERVVAAIEQVIPRHGHA